MPEPDKSFNFDEQLVHDLRQKQDMAQRMTDASWKNFNDQLPGWKAQMLFIQNPDNKDKGLPIPLPPTPPVIVTIDQAIHRQIFTRRWSTRAPVVGIEYDTEYFVFKPAPLPEGIMDLTPRNTPPPTNAKNPIGPEDPGMGHPGWYNDVGGDSYKEGDLFFDAATTRRYWKVKLPRVSPFNPVPVYRWGLEGVAKPEHLNW